MAYVDDTIPDADRKLQAWRMRVAGIDIDTISQTVGRDKSTVYRWLRAKLAEIVQEETATAEEYRQQQIARLDNVIAQQTTRMVDKGNIRSADSANAITRAIELQNKLLGIEAAQRLDITQTNLTFADMLRYATQQGASPEDSGADGPTE